MGTTPEWLEVLTTGLFWLCAKTLLLVIFKRSIPHIRSYLSIRNTLVWFSAALWFGIVDTFQSSILPIPCKTLSPSPLPSSIVTRQEIT
jgi:hypothetical protein